VPLLANTVGALYLSVLTSRVETVADAWLQQEPEASVSSVDLSGSDVVIEVQTPSTLPPVDSLLADLKGQVPDGVNVVITTTLGQRFDAGTVGQ
jgi:hypothetical protein